MQLFFLVSAYTLMASFHSRKTETFPLRNFFIRRFFRIAPLYYLAILYFTFQRFIGFGYFATGQMAEHLPVTRFFSYVFFLNGFNPYWINNLVPGGWSIAVEMSFYAVLPLFFRYVKNGNHAVWLLAGSVVFRIVMELLLHKTFFNTNEYLFYYLPNQLPVFSLGILAFFVVRDGFSSFSAGSLVCLAALFFLLNFAMVGTHFNLSVAYFFLLVALAKKPFKLLANKGLAQVGQVSFSLYLVHFAVLYWLQVLQLTQLIAVHYAFAAALDFLLRFALLFGVSFLVSIGTYRFIERPFQRHGKALIAYLNRHRFLQAGSHPVLQRIAAKSNATSARS